MPHVRSQFSTSTLWVNPLVSKPPDTQPDGRCEHQPREMCHHENVHMCHLHTSQGAGSHTALLSYVPTGRALSYITLLLLRAHTGRSQPLRAHTGRSQPLTLQGSAGLSAQSGGCGPAAITFFTTFITLTAYKSLKHYSRQVIPAAASYLREPRSGERHKGPVWLWNLGSCDRETG